MVYSLSDLKSSGPLLFVDNKVKKQSSVSQSSDLLDDHEETSSSSLDQDDQIAWLNAVEKHGAPEEPSEGAADPSDEWDEYEEVPQEEKYEDVPQSEEHNETGQWENLKWHFDDDGTQRPGWVKGSGADQSEGAAQSEEAEQHKWLEGEGADDRTWDDVEGTDSDYVSSDEDYHDAMDEGDLQSDGMDPIEWSEHTDQLDWDGDEGYSPSDWDEDEGIVQSEGGLENGKADENQSNETILSEEFQGNRTSLSEAHTEGANYSEWGASVGTVQDAESAGGFGVPPGHPTEQQDAPDELKARMRRNPAQSTWGKMLTDNQE
ncbi:hypothetical protein EOD39_20052 [Acipenser ruthenus]|uniref:Uncharacterized protein n=1 Tax=Acipenser ruthenus TaxID=7906 RepID=A0A444UWJ7_ACIRT|nr:hypothetical protein EOD39_20052 [Acipenser ruthenus]